MYSYGGYSAGGAGCGSCGDRGVCLFVWFDCCFLLLFLALFVLFSFCFRFPHLLAFVVKTHFFPLDLFLPFFSPRCLWWWLWRCFIFLSSPLTSPLSPFALVIDVIIYLLFWSRLFTLLTYLFSLFFFRRLWWLFGSWYLCCCWARGTKRRREGTEGRGKTGGHRDIDGWEQQRKLHFTQIVLSVDSLWLTHMCERRMWNLMFVLSRRLFPPCSREQHFLLITYCFFFQDSPEAILASALVMPVPTQVSLLLCNPPCYWWCCLFLWFLVVMWLFCRLVSFLSVSCGAFFLFPFSFPFSLRLSIVSSSGYGGFSGTCFFIWFVCLGPFFCFGKGELPLLLSSACLHDEGVPCAFQGSGYYITEEHVQLDVQGRINKERGVEMIPWPFFLILGNEICVCVLGWSFCLFIHSFLPTGGYP